MCIRSTVCLVGVPVDWYFGVEKREEKEREERIT